MRLLIADSTTRGYGTEQHAAALAIAVMRHGHAVRCLVRAGSSMQAILVRAQVPHVTVGTGWLSGTQFTVRMLQLVRRDRPDWLVTGDGRFHWMFMLLKRLTGVRVAFFRHWPVVPKKKRTRDMLARRADRLILVSRFHREEYRRQGMDVARASVLYNPIDTERIRPSAESRARTRARLHLADADIVVGYVGRMVEDKGIFALLEASEHFLADAPRARMLWVGDGRDVGTLRARAARSPLAARHVFLEWQLDMAEIYPGCDLIVVPSICPETFGRVSVEAQSAGVPVVVSDAGGLVETVVPGVTGLLAVAGDRGALARAVSTLIGDPDRRRLMGVAGREWVCSKFAFENIAREFEALLSESRPQRLAALPSRD